MEQFKCPHCGHPLGPSENAYFYGSPFRVCNKCKQTYVDNRYHEIALEGIRPQDITPTEGEKKNRQKDGMKKLWIGIGLCAAFVLILFTGWIVFPLPIIGVGMIVSGVKVMKGAGAKGIEKTKRALALEEQQSRQRMQDPAYVEKLRSIGYQIPSYEQPVESAQPQVKFCSSCGTRLNGDGRFCPNCGAQI